jgi:hypothetical protein
MTGEMSTLVLEGGVVLAFGLGAAFLGLLFSRQVIGRYGVGWLVGLAIPTIAVGLGFAALWMAQSLFDLLDPPEAVAPPDTGSGALDLALLPVFVVAQAGAGFEHIYAVLSAAGITALAWMLVAGWAAFRWRRGLVQGAERKG